MPEPTTEPTVIPISAALGQTVPAQAALASPASEQPNAAASRGDTATAPLAAAFPERSNTPQPRTEQSSKLRDIQIGKPDGRGLEVTHIYATQADEYVIYQAGEVMVHFADDQAKAQLQRKAILPLSSTRAEVNSLLQGLTCREVCDRQLAYALQVALDGDLEGAKATTALAKAAVLAKRAARGRFQYLKWSYGSAAALIGLLFLASRLYPFQEASSDLWLAAKAGLIGAAFSIALAIRGRTVALDTDLLDNVTDGTLRLVIGVISAGVILMLLASGILPSLKIGDANFSGGSLTWQMVLVVGFVAGFLERLVPDLLEKKNSQVNGSMTTAGVAASR